MCRLWETLRDPRVDESYGRWGRREKAWVSGELASTPNPLLERSLVREDPRRGVGPVLNSHPQGSAPPRHTKTKVPLNVPSDGTTSGRGDEFLHLCYRDRTSGAFPMKEAPAVLSRPTRGLSVRPPLIDPATLGNCFTSHGRSVVFAAGPVLWENSSGVHRVRTVAERVRVVVSKQWRRP